MGEADIYRGAQLLYFDRILAGTGRFDGMKSYKEGLKDQ